MLWKLSGQLSMLMNVDILDMDSGKHAAEYKAKILANDRKQVF